MTDELSVAQPSTHMPTHFAAVACEFFDFHVKSVLLYLRKHDQQLTIDSINYT